MSSLAKYLRGLATTLMLSYTAYMNVIVYAPNVFTVFKAFTDMVISKPKKFVMLITHANVYYLSHIRKVSLHRM